MANTGPVSETLIFLSMLNQIVVDDLFWENHLDLFEEKKRWHDLWQRETKKAYGLEGDLLGWEQLKEMVVEWLKDERAFAGREVILEMCCSFKPYGELPERRHYGRTCMYEAGKQGKAWSGLPKGSSLSQGRKKRDAGYRAKEQARVQASPEARELSLEKICRLLGLEEKWQEHFSSEGV